MDDLRLAAMVEARVDTLRREADEARLAREARRRPTPRRRRRVPWWRILWSWRRVELAG